MKQFISIIACAFFAIALCSCNPTKELEANAMDIQFTELQNYFVNNYIPSSKEQHLYINSQQEFEQYFGQATVMGANGQPTEVNFKKQFVVALIRPETNRATSIHTTAVKQNGNAIILYYHENKGDKGGYTVVPFTAVAIDKPQEAQNFQFYFRKN
ncbi:MAG: hypothetical protein J6X81_01620 [Muribaculaceae bacterium]|nr:hypothetical protein [Muribaculaceae bacterium]